LFTHKIAFQESTSSALLISAGGSGYVTSCRISNSSQAAISVSDGTLFVQNSFVGIQNFNVPAVSLTSGTVEIEYSTLGTVGGGANSSAVLCTNGGGGSSIRNSIALTFSAAPEIMCAGATLEDVFLEADANEPFSDTSTWFADFPNGDFHIADNAPTAFTEPLSTFATWTAGDPLVDIDGDPRVGIDGEPDYAGADVPQ
jgi:hypothetical protein